MKIIRESIASILLYATIFLFSHIHAVTPVTNRYSIINIDNYKLNNTSANGLWEKIAVNVPGMYVSKSSITGNSYNDYMGGNIYFNGSGGTSFTSPDIYVDGIPQRQSMAYNYNYNIIDTEEISDISVVKNSTPILGYGTSASGLIDINTIEKRTPGFYDKLSAKIGTCSVYKLNYINSFKVNNINSFLSVRYQGNASEKKRYESDNSFLAGRYRMGISLYKTLKLHIGGAFAKDVYRTFINKGKYDAETKDDKYRMENLRSSIYTSLTNNSKYVKGDLSIYFNYNDVNNLFGYNSTEKYYGFILHQTITLREGTSFTLGADYRGSYYNLEKDKNNLLSDYKMSELAMFFNIRHALIANALFLTGGIRNSHNVDIESELLPEIGFELTATKNIFISAKIAKGFAVANLYDKFILYPGLGIDRNLIPEKYYAYSSVVGVASENNRFNAKLTMCIKNYSNKIGYVDNSITNISDVYSFSGDLALNLKLSKRSALDFSCSYSKFENCTVYAPLSIINGGYTLSLSHISCRIDYKHIMELSYLSMPGYKDDYGLLGAKMNCNLSKGICVNLSVNNILNERYKYASGIKAPGICWEAGMIIQH